VTVVLPTPPLKFIVAIVFGDWFAATDGLLY